MNGVGLPDNKAQHHALFPYNMHRLKKIYNNWLRLFLFLTTLLLFTVPKAQIAFTENKGQWNREVLFQANLGGHIFFLTQDGYVVLMHHTQDLEQLAAYYHGHPHDANGNPKKGKVTPISSIRSHAYRVRLLGSNRDIKILKEKQQAGYENFFIGNDPSRWASECFSYQSITYQNIYPGIDLRYYIESDQLKYDFILQPGANAAKIQLQYEGASNLVLKDKALQVQTSVGTVMEKEPYSYQFLQSGRERVKCRYRLKHNVVSLIPGAYDKSSNLIIDPQMVFSSFSRATGDNWGFTATPGPDGSMFGGGITTPTGFPVTTGAFQTRGRGPENGNSPLPPDIAIIKLSPNGRDRIYATYLGGEEIEQPHSLIADAEGNLIVAGRTASGNTFPGTLFGPGGGFDIYITKFNATGTRLIGSVKIGGTWNDGVNVRAERFQGPGSIMRNYGDDGRSEVNIDANNNILLASSSQSDDFFVRNGLQTTLRGDQDGVVIKLNPDATDVLWSTYLGGDGTDAAFVLSANPQNKDIYIGGGTTSNNFPGTTVSALQATYNGGIADGYICRLRDLGSAITVEQTTYLGTNQTDLVYGVQFDAKGFTYAMGTTTGLWPRIAADYYDQNARQFIVKLNPELTQFIYSTTFGTPNAPAPNISPVAFLVDNCENVYVSGWGGDANVFSDPPYPTSGTNGMRIKSAPGDFVQSQTDGSDFYFFVLEKNARNILYGSYFGQLGGNGSLEHVDGGTSRFDAQGFIYQAACANCKQVPGSQPNSIAPFPITAGVFGNVNPATSGGRCNLGMTKIRFDFTGVDVDIKTVARQLTFCSPAAVEFEDPIRKAKKYIWIWGDNSKNDTTVNALQRHNYNNVGFYDVKVIGIDSATCNIKDSSLLRIKVTTDSVALGFTSKVMPPCNSLIFEFTNTSDRLSSVPNFTSRSFVWKWGDGSRQDTIAGFPPNFVTHQFPGAGTYKVELVLIDTNFCNVGQSFGTFNFQVTPNIRAGFGASNGCAPYALRFQDSTVGAQRYLWEVSDGQTSSDPNPQFQLNTPGIYTIKQTIFNDNSCNKIDSTTRSVEVSGAPSAGFSYSPLPPKENTPTNFFSNTSADVVKWEWDFGDGSASEEKNPTHQFEATNFFRVCQTVTNANNCTDSACQSVEALVSILFDLPNAFTPNGDGMNDIFQVRGFGITNMTFRIFNRQGLLVFESKSPNIGWDGTYQNKPQPMDTYAWTLDIEYFNGEKTRKNGEVTLIR
ncbi:MAG: gliding motility-associated C-terminal domain-containing protein [Bacteroidetes bacterium]|nr:gliding motility-associated C-terminal domain-containing protein [Bacteroidota bacterium]